MPSTSGQGDSMVSMPRQLSHRELLQLVEYIIEETFRDPWHTEGETKWPSFSKRHFQTYFLEENLLYFDENLIEMCFPWLINNIPALVQIMPWPQTDDKPLSEPVMALFNDAFMCHSASMSKHTKCHRISATSMQMAFDPWNVFPMIDG